MTEELPLQAQVDLWRQKAIAGTLSDDELRDAIKRIRADRVSAATAAASRKRAVPARSAEELLSSIGGLMDEEPSEGSGEGADSDTSSA